MRTTNRKILKIAENTNFYPKDIMLFDFFVKIVNFFGAIENTADKCTQSGYDLENTLFSI